MEIDEISGSPPSRKSNRDSGTIFRRKSHTEHCSPVSLRKDIRFPMGNSHTNRPLVFDKIIDSCLNGKGGVFFVNGSGGMGKTFLWKTIITKLRSEGKIVLALASSGIVSLLLPGGRTTHSHFKIPLQTHEASCCAIGKK